MLINRFFYFYSLIQKIYKILINKTFFAKANILKIKLHNIYFYNTIFIQNNIK